ncbi:MAG: site-specific integrase [Bacteroidetes bacterium]|nr:site-specific integrase [Bacteroidota bacterium]
MAIEIRLFLKTRTQKKSAVILTVRDRKQGKALRLSTGVSVPVALWNTAEDKVSRKHPQATTINSEFAAILQSADGLVMEAVRLKKNPFELLKAELPKMHNCFKREAKAGHKNAEDKTLFDYYAEFEAQHKRKVNEGTMKVLRTVKNHLRQWYGKDEVKITEFAAKKTSADFTDFLYGEKELTDNSAHKIMRTLRQFVNWQESTYGTEFPKGFLSGEKTGIKQREADVIALTDEELRRLVALDLTDAPNLDNVRNLFVVACFTGLRFSDVSRLKPEHLQGENIRLQVTKTRSGVTIPLHPQLAEFIAGLQGRGAFPFNAISNQRANNLLKRIGELAEIVELREVVRYRRGVQIARTVPKYDLLTTHTGRRTFVTLCLQKGLLPDTIKLTTGHKTLSSFEKYIRHESLAVGKAMSAAWTTEPKQDNNR